MEKTIAAAIDEVQNMVEEITAVIVAANPNDSTEYIAAASSSTSSSNGITSSSINPMERATSIFTSLGQTFLSSSSIPWQGLCLPCKSCGFALRVAFVCTRMVFVRLSYGHAKVRRLVARVQTTLRGSADDCGWLQKASDLPPVEDATKRFLEIFDRISHGSHTLPNDFVYLLVPGLFSNHGPLYFVDTKKYFSRLGLTCHIARIHSEAAVETNARELKGYIEELYWGTGKRIVLLGHSKGGVDAAAAASMFWEDVKEKIAGIVLVQSPYGGTPVASDILREGQIADMETRRIMEIIICKVIKGDMHSLDDLTYDRRRQFLAKYPLPNELPVVCFHTEAGRSPGVLSTLSHIAHAELPWLALPSSLVPSSAMSSSPSASSSASSAAVAEAAAAASVNTGAKLPVVLPLAAAMAAVAFHLELRYGEKSDGLVLRRDAEVPGSVVVRPDRKLDHAWMVYSGDPDAFFMCEALIALLLEVSAAKKKKVE